MATGFESRTQEDAEREFEDADAYNRDTNAMAAEYNSRPAPYDWNDELAHQQVMDTQRQTQDRNAAMAQRINTQRGVLDGYVRYGIGKIEKAKQAQDIWGDHLASAMLLASRNNGQLPQYMIPGLNEARGLDGKTATIYGGGYTKDGKGFVLAVARKDPQTGQITPDRDASVQLDLRGMYDLMYNKPGIFSRQQLQGVHDLLSEQVKDRSSGQDSLPDIPKEWGEVGNVGVGNRTETGGTAVPSSWLYGPQRRSSISAFGSDGRGGFTQYDSDESTGYRLQSRDFGTRERTWDGMSERERVARINAASRERQAQTDADAKIAAAEVRGAGRGTGAGVPRGTSVVGGQEKYNKDKYAALKERLDAIEYEEDEDGNRKKRVLDDNEKAVAAKIRSQMDAMLGIGGEAEQPENSAPPPQQRLVYYRDSQGNLKSGNGYVQGGRVYGADGRLIEGARETSPKLERMKEEQAKREAAKDKAAAGAGKKVAGVGGAAPGAATGTSGDDTMQTARGGNGEHKANPVPQRNANVQTAEQDGIIAEEQVRRNPGTIAEQSAALGKRVGEALSDYAGDVGYVASETARKLGEGYQTGELGTEPAFRYDANSGRNAVAGSKEETLPPKKKRTRQNARVRRSTDSGPTFRADLQRQRASDVARREREEADRERWERLDARLAELQAERDEAARQKRQGREWSAREKKYQQDLRLAMKERDRIQKLYESGDVDAIRKHEQEVNELEALVGQLMGEE